MNAKENAARKALEFVKDRMTVGLGTGSTAAIFVTLLAEKAKKENWKITCVPTSIATEKQAIAAGLTVIGMDKVEHIDVDVDGADNVDKHFNVLKGLGGALTREKVVAYESKKFVIIADESKMKPLEGIVPIEVIPFAWASVLRELKRRGIPAEMRLFEDKSFFVSDNGNFIIHAKMKVADAKKTELELNGIPGVVENGIFTRCDAVVIGSESGARVITP